MAVYTAVPRDVLDAWLSSHAVGTLVDVEGIAAGIENSNYFVSTRDEAGAGRFVLTIFERLSIDELPWYLDLMNHLALHDVPCPAPMADRSGAFCTTLVGKPAALVTCLQGASVLRPGRAHCAAMGRALARMHLAAVSFPSHRTNPRGFAWWMATAARVRVFLDDARRALLDAELAMQRSDWQAAIAGLPRSAIHADLFRDNALFVEQADGTIALGGVIDFYFAGDDAWVLDLAICLNDWCVDLIDGRFDRALLDAFVGAYETVRPIGPDERRALPQVLCAAALRFWLSRLDDLHRPRPAELLTPHDPGRFERVLRCRRGEMLGGSSPFSS